MRELPAFNFINQDARNASLWTDLRSLPSTRFYKGETQLSPQDVDAIPELKNGVGVRLAVFPYSTSHLEVMVLVSPLSLKEIQSKAKDWNLAPESLDFPAINISDHWSRY